MPYYCIHFPKGQTSFPVYGVWSLRMIEIPYLIEWPNFNSNYTYNVIMKLCSGNIIDIKHRLFIASCAACLFLYVEAILKQISYIFDY